MPVDNKQLYSDKFPSLKCSEKQRPYAEAKRANFLAKVRAECGDKDKLAAIKLCNYQLDGNWWMDNYYTDGDPHTLLAAFIGGLTPTSKPDQAEPEPPLVKDEEDVGSTSVMSKENFQAIRDLLLLWPNMTYANLGPHIGVSTSTVFYMVWIIKTNSKSFIELCETGIMSTGTIQHLRAAFEGREDLLGHFTAKLNSLLAEFGGYAACTLLRKLITKALASDPIFSECSKVWRKRLHLPEDTNTTPETHEQILLTYMQENNIPLRYKDVLARKISERLYTDEDLNVIADTFIEQYNLQ